MNHNVLVTYVFNFLSGLADGICNSTVAPALIFLLTNSNAKVGIVEALDGTGEALAAIPIGMVVDRSTVKRQTVLRWGGTLGIICAFLTVIAVYYEHFGGICFAFFLLGMWNAFNQVPVDAIFADSIPTGKRSGIYNMSFVLGTLSQATGPLIAIGTFYYFGNHWKISECRNVIYVGCSIAFLSALVQFLFLESKTLGHESEAIQVTSSPVEPTSKGDFDEDPVSPLMARSLGFLTADYVPWIIGLSNIIAGLASGMTIKFFPLFFQYEVHLSPVAVNAIFAASPLCIGICSTLIQALSKYFGRIEISIFARTIGIGLLIFMAIAKQFWDRPEIIIPVYVLRTALMNSTFPLMKSVMMDFVPKKTRGKWSAVNSIASFGWSGSAVLGGYLVDHEGYGFSFHITAAVQALSTVLWLFLLPIVPREAHSTAIALSNAAPPTTDVTSISDGLTSVAVDTKSSMPVDNPPSASSSRSSSPSATAPLIS